jgi:hypothetical protein
MSLPNLLHYHNSFYIRFTDDANGLSANRCTTDVVLLIMVQACFRTTYVVRGNESDSAVEVSLANP